MHSFKDTVYSLLRKTEKYTKTDMVYLFKGSSWMVVYQVCVSLSSFILATAFANLVSQEVYGQYKYVISVSAFLSSFGLLGLGTGVLRLTAQGQEGSLRKAFTYNLYSSGLLVVVGLGISTYYFLQSNLFLAIAFAATSLFLPILNSTTLYGSFLYGKKDFQRASLLMGGTSLATTVVMIVLLFFFRNPLPLVIGYFISNILANGIAYLYILKKYKPNNFVDVKELKTYSLHQSAIGLLATISDQLDKILIFQVMGASQLAVYSFAVAMPEQVRALFKNMTRLAFPKFAESNLENARKDLVYRMSLAAGVIFLLSLVYYFLAPYIFALLFPQYLSAVRYSQIYSLFIFTVVSFIPVMALQALGLNKRLYTFTLTSNIFDIVLNVTLIYFYGIWGGIWATIISRIFTLVTSTSLVLITTKSPVTKTAPEETL